MITLTGSYCLLNISLYDTRKWAVKILFLSNNPEICKVMGSKGRSKVLKKFNLTMMTNNMERLYQKLVSNAYRAY